MEPICLDFYSLENEAEIFYLSSLGDGADIFRFL